MHHRDLLAIVAISALCFISILVWLYNLKRYLEIRRQKRREEEIFDRVRRVIEVRDDSDYESSGEEEQEIMDLVHSHGFYNPMFEL
uniref:Protein Vpu n=1 Tax=Human immunodeficiency virus type 1 TaxID=11676 RepID=D2JNU2_HV1|nr:vpu protein [Human immunodeficiency virus 1]